MLFRAAAYFGHKLRGLPISSGGETGQKGRVFEVPNLVKSLILEVIDFPALASLGVRGFRLSAPIRPEARAA